MFEQKPYALSCDKNGPPILEKLKSLLSGRTSLLEVGSGTGQHAIFMAPSFPDLIWTLSDQEDRHTGIQAWLKDFPRANVRGPMTYQIGRDAFPVGQFDVVFTANTIHILAWPLCLRFFDDLAQGLASQGLFIVYGAFNYDGQFTSESNREFDKWLKERDRLSGVRDFEKVRDELETRGLSLFADLEMPANNRLLVFQNQ